MRNKREALSNPGEKPANFKESIGKLLKHSKPFRAFIIIALILSALSSVLTIMGPDRLKEITDLITTGFMSSIDLDAVKTIGITLVIMYSCGFIFDYVQGLIMASVTNKYSKQLRSAISSKINKLPLSYFDKTTIGDVLSRVTNDVDTIGQTMNQSIGSLVSALTMFLGTLFMMYKTNWIMASTAIVSTILGFSIMMIILKKSQKYFVQVQSELGALNGHIEEVYSGHNVVKVYNGKNDVHAKFDEINEKLYTSGRKSQFYSGIMMPLMHFVGNFGYVAVCIVGASLAMNNHISFGVIVAFMVYIRFFTNPLSQIAQGLTQLQSTAAASERVFTFLEETEMTSEANLTTKLDMDLAKGDIKFDNVHFGYTEDKVIIKGFSADIKAGSKIAIVGPTGAGKTTIVNLLMKFYEINDGDIIIDGISTKLLTRENIHDLFVMVLQDTWLFEGSINDNVRYNQTQITDEQIVQVCKAVGMHHFIKTLPQGYDTVLNDIESLSAGQKQLLTLARAMLEDGPFLILDEATSSVDTRTEVLVQKSMDRLSTGKTSFIIAHRLSTIKNADLILVMNDGNIIEQGNHEKLLAKKGFYAELYNSQFQNAEE